MDLQSLRKSSRHLFGSHTALRSWLDFKHQTSKAAAGPTLLPDMPGSYMPEGGQTPKTLMEYAPPGVQPEPPRPTAPQPQDTSYSTGGGDFGPAEQAPTPQPAPQPAAPNSRFAKPEAIYDQEQPGTAKPGPNQPGAAKPGLSDWDNSLPQPGTKPGLGDWDNSLPQPGTKPGLGEWRNGLATGPGLHDVDFSQPPGQRTVPKLPVQSYDASLPQGPGIGDVDFSQPPGQRTVPKLPVQSYDASLPQGPGIGQPGPSAPQPQAPAPEQAPMPRPAPQPQAPVQAPGQPAAQQAPAPQPQAPAPQPQAPVQAPGQPAAQQAPGMAKPMGKIGMVPHIAGIAPEAASFNEGVKADALRRILGIGGMGLAGGAGIAGLMQLFKHIAKPKMPSYEVPEDIEMPYPQIAEKKSFSPTDLQHVGQAIGGVGLKGALMHGDDGLGSMAAGAARELPNAPLTALGSLVGKHQMQSLVERLAPKQKLLKGLAGIMGMVGGGGGGYAVSKPTIGSLTKESDWADSIVHNVIPTPSGVPAPSVGTPGWLRGDTQKSITSLPWGIPAAMGAGLGGLMGGGALVNWLMKKHRKAKLKGEVEKATKDYESAMLAQYDPKKIHKIGSEVVTLDKLGDQAEKQGFDFNAILGTGAGSYGALAALLAGASGYGTYKWQEGRSKDKLLEKALKQRAMMRSLEHPPDIYINPVGMPLKHNAGTADELDTEASRPAL